MRVGLVGVSHDVPDEALRQMIALQRNVDIIFDLPTAAWLGEAAARHHADVVVVRGADLPDAQQFNTLLRAQPRLRVIALAHDDAGAVVEMAPRLTTLGTIADAELHALISGGPVGVRRDAHAPELGGPA